MDDKQIKAYAKKAIKAIDTIKSVTRIHKGKRYLDGTISIPAGNDFYLATLDNAGIGFWGALDTLDRAFEKGFVTDKEYHDLTNILVAVPGKGALPIKKFVGINNKKIEDSVDIDILFGK